MYNQADVQAYEMEEPERPAGLMEAIILFGGLVVIFDGIGAVIGRLTAVNVPVCACLNIFLYAGAGFMAARHWTIANGVWAGIGVASIDAVLGQVLIAAILPNYRELITGQIEQVSDGVLIAVLVGALFAMVIGALISGALFGAIGAAISHSGPFRPKYIYDWD